MASLAPRAVLLPERLSPAHCLPGHLKAPRCKVGSAKHIALRPVCVARQEFSNTTRVQAPSRPAGPSPGVSTFQSSSKAAQQQEEDLQLPPAVAKYAAAWAAVPSRYKIVLAGSLSFVICNMVGAVVESGRYCCMMCQLLQLPGPTVPTLYFSAPLFKGSTNAYLHALHGCACARQLSRLRRPTPCIHVLWLVCGHQCARTRDAPLQAVNDVVVVPVSVHVAVVACRTR
jgi:hypothetical protein